MAHLIDKDRVLAEIEKQQRRLCILGQSMEESNENRQLYSRIFRRGFKAGAKWQKEQDKETIELAEDHAMLVGMNKMEQQMMKRAVDGILSSTITGSEQVVSANVGYGELGKNGDKVKLIIIKEA